MIDPHIPAFLLIGVGFLKKGVAADEFAWKPTKNDVLALRAELKQYEPKIINGRKQYAIEQHMQKAGAISFGEFGERMILSPELYKKIDDTYGLHQWMQEKDMEQLFQAYPEEEVAHKQKIAELFKDFRKVDKGIIAA